MNPKIRFDLQIQNVTQGSERFLVVQDPLGIMEQPLCLTEFGHLLLSLLDGSRTAQEVESLFREAAGGQLPEGMILSQIAEFERNGVLQGPVYFQKRREIVDGFTLCERRAPSHAGIAYEADPQALADWIDNVVGPAIGSVHEPPSLVVAPHIDFRVNTSVYAAAYRPLLGQSYDRVLLMGTGHAVGEGVYCPTRKKYITPLGATTVDSQAMDRIGQAGDGILSPDDFPHRAEHALEFQLIFLQRLLGADSFEAIPILCGSFPSGFQPSRQTADHPHLSRFWQTLRSLVEEDGRKTLVVAGVDFSHVGRRFSHTVDAVEMLEETRRHDRALIEAFCAWNPEDFWRTEMESDGRHNVCGFTTLATILEIMEPRSSRCLAYDVWDDSPTGSAVTFAAIVG